MFIDPDKMLPCGHQAIMHDMSTLGSRPLPNAACSAAAKRYAVSSRIAIERSAVGDGRFIEAARVEPGVRDLTTAEAMARALDGLAVALRKSTGT